MTAHGKKVLVVSDHPLMLEAIGVLLERNDFLLAGMVATAAEAVSFLAEHAADAVVFDLDLRGEDPLVRLRELRRLCPDAAVVVFTETEAGRDIDAGFREGVVACVRKSAVPEDLVTAVRQAFDKSIFLSTPGFVPFPRQEPDHSPRLTPRELEILLLVAQGGTNAELARQLWVTEQTIKFHLSNIYRKLGVSNRTEASRTAQLRGLLHTEQARKRSS